LYFKHPEISNGEWNLHGHSNSGQREVSSEDGAQTKLLRAIEFFLIHSYK
jgi:hypothetical protein